jgi:hypothetical protein
MCPTLTPAPHHTPKLVHILALPQPLWPFACRAGAHAVYGAELSQHMCDAGEEATISNGFLGRITMLDRCVCTCVGRWWWWQDLTMKLRLHQTHMHPEQCKCYLLPSLLEYSEIRDGIKFYFA